MANEYGYAKVNGPAKFAIKFPRGPVLLLGISIGEGGFEIVPQIDYNAIPSDVAGTRPADQQQTGIGYVINIRAAYFNDATIDAMMKVSGVAEGTPGPYGKPMLANNLMFELGITAEQDTKGPHHFYGCYLDPKQFMAGTKATIRSFSIVANPPVGNASSMGGIKVYDRTNLQ